MNRSCFPLTVSADLFRKMPYQQIFIFRLIYINFHLLIVFEVIWVGEDRSFDVMRFLIKIVIIALVLAVGVTASSAQENQNRLEQQIKRKLEKRAHDAKDFCTGIFAACATACAAKCIFSCSPPTGTPGSAGCNACVDPCADTCASDSGCLPKAR
jgi:amino acid permease